MKNDNTIFWIIGIVILLVVVANYYQAPEEEEMIGLTPHYYKDGVEVFPTKGFLGFSVVTPPGGSYDQISFDISATNLDVPITNIQVVDASPIAFKNALPTTTQSLAIGENKTLWTSGLMDTVQFEAVSPVNFWIEVSGKNTYTDETIYPDRSYSGDISFQPYVAYSTYTCYSGDVYWYDNLGVRNDKKEECGTSLGLIGYYCYDNDVYSDYITRGCSGSVCTQSTTRTKEVECTYGCLNGECNLEPIPPWTYTGESYSLAILDWPNDIFFDGTNWWMAGAYTSKIYKYDSNWNYLGISYYMGQEENRARLPWDIFLDGINWLLGRFNLPGYPYYVFKYDSNWNYLGVREDSGILRTTGRIYVSSEDTEPSSIHYDGINWWMSGRDTNRVYKYDSDWNYLGISYYVGNEGTPIKIYHDGINWWMLDFYDGKVYKYTG